MKPIIDNILLIDDNEIDTLVSKTIIRRMNVTTEISIVHDGRRGIDFIKQNRSKIESGESTLVLLDLNMPGMHGFQFLEEFVNLNLNENIKVAVLSSSEDTKDIEMALDFNVLAYLVKPLSEEKLTSIIKKL